MVEFRILGPVQAVGGGRELGLGGPKRRAVLALLLVAAGQVVPADRLIEELWGGCPPPGAAGTLRSYVSRLRTLLRPDAVLVAQGGGYALAVKPDQLDASRFERLVGAGRAALERGEAAVAAGRFREALGLWRGRALADVVDVEPLALEGARLEELRLVAVEGRIEADIELGLAADVTGELEGLVAEHPVRERLWRLLVLALYRSQRQADALAAYRRARAMLAAELGIEPGEELRGLERAVLRQEVPAAVARRERHNLPVRLTSFVGRERELAALEELVGGARLVTLTGPGGAGKTRLAVEFAAGAVERFGDGAWLADLAGIADPELVPSQVMETLGVRQSGEVAVIEALRYRLRSAELLLILDNCEHVLGACAGLAATLLRSSAGLRVLATSRESLGVPGEAAYPVAPLAVPPETSDAQALARAPAVRLFLARGSAARAGAGVQAAPVAVVARICRELDGLPLAIELAAARTSVLSVQEIQAHLADKLRFLTYRRPVADPRHQALNTAIGWSYELLPENERRVFGALSVFAGGFDLAAVAAVCCGGDEPAALDLVDQLASKSLVVAEPADGRTRYRLLETIREYAADRLAEAGEAERARRRHAAAFLRLAEQERQLAVLLREHDNFRAALDHALTGGGETGPRLARALGGFWLARGLFQEGRDWLERALAVCPADERLRTDLLRLLGALLYASGDLARAQATLAEGLQAAAAARLPSVQARIRVLLAEIHAVEDGRYAEALEACEAAVPLLESEGDLEGLAEVWLTAGKVRFFSFDALGAEEALERAAACARRSANHRAELESRTWLIGTFEDLPLPADVAIGRGEQLLEAASGDPWAEASDTPLSFASIRLRWPLRRRPRGLPARPGHTHRGRGKIRLGHIRNTGRPHGTDRRGLRRGRADPAARVRSAPRDGRTRISRNNRHHARRGGLRAGAFRPGAAADRRSRGARRRRRHRRPGPLAGNTGETARTARPVRRRRPAGRGSAGADPGNVLRAAAGRNAGREGRGVAAGRGARRSRSQPAQGAAALSGPADGAPSRAGPCLARQPRGTTPHPALKL